MGGGRGKERVKEEGSRGWREREGEGGGRGKERVARVVGRKGGSERIYVWSEGRQHR